MKRNVAITKRGKFFWGAMFIMGLLALAVVAMAYFATRPVEIEFAQEPNPLEAYYGNGKLKLLEEALAGKKKGFVRLSEAEINSLLETRYNDPKKLQTNAPVALVRTGVLLHQTNFTFVSWHKVRLANNFFVPFVWQRTMSPARDSTGGRFEVNSMRLGRIDIPRLLWPKVAEVFGQGDNIFADRHTWLSSLPKVALMKNELSLAPELRLFSYDPAQTATQDSP